MNVGNIMNQILTTLKLIQVKGLPITAPEVNVNVDVPPINVAVDSAKTPNDFLFHRSAVDGTTEYIQYTHGGLAKHYIMKLENEILATYYAGDLGSTNTDWANRATLAYTNALTL